MILDLRSLGTMISHKKSTMSLTPNRTNIRPNIKLQPITLLQKLSQRLATEFNYKNIPDLKPSTDYEQLVSLKNSCDIYADMILNSATDEEAKTLTDILNLT